MAFAVDAKDAPVGIDDGDGVEIGLPRAFEERHRQDDTQFARQRGEAGDQRMALNRRGPVEIARVLGDTEIGAVEQFLQQDHLPAFGRRATDHRLGPVGIGGVVGCGRELGDGKGDLTHPDSPPAR